ncbi:hypothetical protein CDAR_304741 [Caerostris darwini]|uniref:Uncharacterized protein n=1 Tax=Caerostris darwini TaxID=1538125 RepID=A0AAV4PTW5_9ARAC|nr:hypothetical protein CDAR_304741 [Caerostris darwini]
MFAHLHAKQCSLTCMQNNVPPTMKPASRRLSVFAIIKLKRGVRAFCRGQLFNYRPTRGVICQTTGVGVFLTFLQTVPQGVLRKNVLPAISPTKKGD